MIIFLDIYLKVSDVDFKKNLMSFQAGF